MLSQTAVLEEFLQVLCVNVQGLAGKCRSRVCKACGPSSQFENKRILGNSPLFDVLKAALHHVDRRLTF